MTFPVGGTVATVPVKIGEHVTVGQTLATLNRSALQAKLDSAKSTLATAQAKLVSDQNAQATGSTVSASTTSATLSGAEHRPGDAARRSVALQRLRPDRCLRRHRRERWHRRRCWLRSAIRRDRSAGPAPSRPARARPAHQHRGNGAFGLRAGDRRAAERAAFDAVARRLTAAIRRVRCGLDTGCHRVRQPAEHHLGEPAQDHRSSGRYQQRRGCPHRGDHQAGSIQVQLVGRLDQRRTHQPQRFRQHVWCRRQSPDAPPPAVVVAARRSPPTSSSSTRPRSTPTR